MPSSEIHGSVSSPTVHLGIDSGSPILNASLDGFLKIGAVGASKVLVEESYHIVSKGQFSSNNLEHGLKRMCKEGAYWGSVAGVYVGMEYGLERARGKGDWTNALIGGAITGAVFAAAGSKDRDKIVLDAITGGAVATASKFINYLV